MAVEEMAGALVAAYDGGAPAVSRWFPTPGPQVVGFRLFCNAAPFTLPSPVQAFQLAEAG
jgi:hypothetical protein